MISLLEDKYSNKSVFLSKLDLLSKINFLIFSAFGFPPGSLDNKKSILFFFKKLETFFKW